jgi:macrolide transport system ATP-binding/permease protein
MSTAVLDGTGIVGGAGEGGRDDATLLSHDVAIPLIELRKVCRTFVTDGGVEVRALRDVDLKIYPGEFLAIMGQSGSGKSTLMNILGCLDRPTSGRYLFAGRDIESFDSDGLAWLRREAFGFVFQSYNLLAHETAEENVEVPGIYAGLSGAERELRSQSLLSSLGLGDRMDHRPNQLSGGQQQRVSIARAMMNGGNIILADEPTGALDSRSGVEVMDLLKELAAKGHTVILITHDANIAANAERIIEFQDGRITNDSGHADGSVDPSKNRLLRELFMSRKTASLIGGLSEAIRMAMRSLLSNAFRTFLTLLGIVIGVASVVALLAIGEGAQSDIVDRISSIGTNVLNLQPQRAEGQRRNMPSSLTFEDADAIVEGVPNVIYSLPRVENNVTVRHGHEDYSTTIIATTEKLPEAKSWPLARGLFFTHQDSEKFTPVAVLGATVYDELWPDGEDPIGEWILLDKVPFQVIGMLTRKGASGNEDQDDAIYVPLKAGALRLFGEKFARNIEVYVDDVGQISQTEDDLIDFMIERHKGTEDFRIFNAAEMLETLEDTQRTLRLFLGAVGGIALLVGGIGVMNIMLVSVTERTREIGVRMATGARQRDIMMQFLAEAIVVSLVGGVLGVGLGFGAGKLVESLPNFDVQVVFNSTPAIIAFTCAAATGLIFGFAPARKAAKLDPVVALANE